MHVYNMSSTTGTYPGDDEDYITRILPQQLNRTSAAASGALAVHFSFYPQREGLENSTDLLDRCAVRLVFVLVGGSNVKSCPAKWANNHQRKASRTLPTCWTGAQYIILFACILFGNYLQELSYFVTVRVQHSVIAME